MLNLRPIDLISYSVYNLEDSYATEISLCPLIVSENFSAKAFQMLVGIVIYALHQSMYNRISKIVRNVALSKYFWTIGDK